MKVTFIGLGIMGSRMAARLLKAGINLTVYNRSKQPKEALKRKGAKIASTLIGSVDDSDLVITMLSDPNAVKAIMTDELLKSMKHNSLWIDCSTVNPSFSKETSRRAMTAGIRFLDAPVAGSKPQAENGELVFMVGGNKEDLTQVEPILKKMGNKILYIGDSGKGSSFKMIVNMLLAHNMVAFSEAIVLGLKMEIDKEFLLTTVPNLPVAAPFTKFKAENIRNDEWAEQFPLELMHKDLRLADITSSEHKMLLPMTNLTKELYAKAETEGMGRLDMSAIYKFLSC